MSAHAVPIIELAASSFLPHTNADKLEVIKIPGSMWQCVSQKGTFKPGNRAVYVPPDYVVPTSYPAFAFLAKGISHRMRAVKLRGEVSFGLLIPLPEDMVDLPTGFNVMERLDIVRYEPKTNGRVGGSGRDGSALPKSEWPETVLGKFDLESLANYPDALVLGEQVIVSEKLHGACASYLYQNDRFYIGSRNQWLRTEPKVTTETTNPPWWAFWRSPVITETIVPAPDNWWRRAAQSDPRIEAWCRAHPNVVLFGEVGGDVQSLKYGCKPGEVKFWAFAAANAVTGEWLPTDELHFNSDLPTVPVVYRGPWHPDAVLPWGEKDSLVLGAPSGHMKEGLVIVPVEERQARGLGRVALKHISTRYWIGDVE
jgi:RNA ligase (TIGR02306 family)